MRTTFPSTALCNGLTSAMGYAVSQPRCPTGQHCHPTRRRTPHGFESFSPSTLTSAGEIESKPTSPCRKRETARGRHRGGCRAKKQDAERPWLTPASERGEGWRGLRPVGVRLSERDGGGAGEMAHSGGSEVEWVSGLRTARGCYKTGFEMSTRSFHSPSLC